MKKKNSFIRSQKMHDRLRQVHADSDTFRGRVKYVYHTQMMSQQSEEKRILTRTEKQSVWKKAVAYIQYLVGLEKKHGMVNRSRAQFKKK